MDAQASGGFKQRQGEGPLPSRGWDDGKGPWYGPDIPEELLVDGEGEAAVGDFCTGDLFAVGEFCAGEFP